MVQKIKQHPFIAVILVVSQLRVILPTPAKRARAVLFSWVLTKTQGCKKREKLLL
jgi:hypothetical protein